MLHLSDLTDDYEDSGFPEIMVEGVADEYQLKMKSLQAEMDGLRTKVVHAALLFVVMCVFVFDIQ